jgi:hypothetical protein
MGAIFPRFSPQPQKASMLAAASHGNAVISLRLSEGPLAAPFSGMTPDEAVAADSVAALDFLGKKASVFPSPGGSEETAASQPCRSAFDHSR